MVDYTDPRWNEADSQNTAPSPNGIATGAAPSSVPGVIRAGMGAQTRNFNRINARGLLSNSGNAYTLTYDVPPVSYDEGVVFSFFVNAANTGAATLSINGMPARALVHGDGLPLRANDLVVGMPAMVVYDGNKFRMFTAAASPSFKTPAVSDKSTAAATTEWVRDALIEYGSPAGAITHFAMATAPAGWLKANGDIVSRSTYARLFAAIGTTYGAGDGATTFKLPDLRGEFVKALDDGRGVDAVRAIGSAQSDDTKSHTHTATASTDSHSHTGTTNNDSHNHTGSTSTDSHAHTVSGGTFRGDQDHLVPGNYITYTGEASEVARSTATSTYNHAHSFTTATNTHNHAFTTAAVSHTHTITVNASGGTETRPRNVALLACIKY